MMIRLPCNEDHKWSIVIRLQYEFSRLFGARTPQADQALEDAKYSMNTIPSYIYHAKNVLKKSQTASRLFQIFTQQILFSLSDWLDYKEAKKRE